MNKILKIIAWIFGFIGMIIEFPIKALTLLALILINIIYVILYPIIKSSQFIIDIKYELKKYLNKTPWYIASKMYSWYAN